MKSRKFFKVLIAALLVLCLFAACTRGATVDEDDVTVNEPFSRTLSTTEQDEEDDTAKATDEKSTNNPNTTEKADETKSTTKEPSSKSTTKAPSNDKTQKSKERSSTKKPSSNTCDHDWEYHASMGHYEPKLIEEEYDETIVVDYGYKCKKCGAEKDA